MCESLFKACWSDRLASKQIKFMTIRLSPTEQKLQAKLAILMWTDHVCLNFCSFQDCLSDALSITSAETAQAFSTLVCTLLYTRKPIFDSEKAHSGSD